MKTTFIFGALSVVVTCISLFMIQSNHTAIGSTDLDGKDIVISSLDKKDPLRFNQIRYQFSIANPGYDLSYFNQVKSIGASDDHRLLFIQKGGGTANIQKENPSKISIGDIVYLKNSRSFHVDSLVDVLVFTIPSPLPKDVPSYIRPDWDPNITDVVGGCATETNAYRRILLTWLGKNGTYLYHGLNAHRVRITNSFTHYHPVDNGFDEFYLVQMATPDAKLITSNKVELITNPSTIKKPQLTNLLQETPLKVGDLVYIPKGVAHRGVGGALVQVITVPGFLPGSEIGIDHHLRAINDRFSLGDGSKKLPFNQEASTKEIIK